LWAAGVKTNSRCRGGGTITQPAQVGSVRERRSLAGIDYDGQVVGDVADSRPMLLLK
jgi:hypothetical protein